MSLHITTIQRIIGKHRHMRHINVAHARDEVMHLANTVGTHTGVDAALCDNLQITTGLPITTLAELADSQWGLEPLVNGMRHTAPT